MSDDSVRAEVWSEALVRAPTVLAPDCLELNSRARKHVAALLWGLVFVVIATEPLNLQNFAFERTSSPTRPDWRAAFAGHGQMWLPEFDRQPNWRARVEDPEPYNGGVRFFERMRRTISDVWSRLYDQSVDHLAEYLDAVLCLAIMALAAPRAIHKLYGAVRIARLRRDASMASRAMSAERRSETRIRTRLRDGLLYDGPRLVCDCVVLDRSHHGARVRTSRPLPPLQKLRFVDSHEKVLYEGRVVWRKDVEAGLELTRLYRVGYRASARSRRN